jgi:hypothetical protein
VVDAINQIEAKRGGVMPGKVDTGFPSGVATREKANAGPKA